MSHFLNLSDLTETADGGAGGSGSGGPVGEFNSQFQPSTVTNPGIPVSFPSRSRSKFRSYREIASNLRDGVSTTGDGLVAALALPDTNSLALHGVLSAEGTDVTGVLGDFHLLHLLTQGGTVSVGNESIFGCFCVAGRGSQARNHVRSRARAKSRDGRYSYLTPYLPVIPTSGRELAF